MYFGRTVSAVCCKVRKRVLQRDNSFAKLSYSYSNYFTDISALSPPHLSFQAVPFAVCDHPLRPTKVSFDSSLLTKGSLPAPNAAPMVCRARDRRLMIVPIGTSSASAASL
jgi:hypothetical protein